MQTGHVTTTASPRLFPEGQAQRGCFPADLRKVLLPHVTDEEVEAGGGNLACRIGALELLGQDRNPGAPPWRGHPLGLRRGPEGREEAGGGGGQGSAPLTRSSSL